MVKNKRGWLRIVESTIAVLIILSAFVILYDTQKVDVKNEPKAQISSVMDFIARNESIRNEILNNGPNLDNYLKTIINNSIDLKSVNYTIKVCSTIENCDPNTEQLGKTSNIYVSEKIISTNLSLSGLQSSKKIRVFYWQIA